jgi:hypothetical protein
MGGGLLTCPILKDSGKPGPLLLLPTTPPSGDPGVHPFQALGKAQSAINAQPMAASRPVTSREDPLSRSSHVDRQLYGTPVPGTPG